MALTTPHVGPWTEEDLLALPEDHQRYELLEGSLLMNPPPAIRHQRISYLLTRVLDDAAPPELRVVEAVGVRLRDNTVFVPDVLVVTREVALADRSGIVDASGVLLVAEIVSPGSRTTDRLTKPALYARAGIGWFWRVEIDEDPRIHAYRRHGDVYREVAEVGPGDRLVLDEPFPLALDPAQLQP